MSGSDRSGSSRAPKPTTNVEEKRELCEILATKAILEDFYESSRKFYDFSRQNASQIENRLREQTASIMGKRTEVEQNMLRSLESMQAQPGNLDSDLRSCIFKDRYVYQGILQQMESDREKHDEELQAKDKQIAQLHTLLQQAGGKVRDLNDTKEAETNVWKIKYEDLKKDLETWKGRAESMDHQLQALKLRPAGTGGKKQNESKHASQNEEKSEGILTQIWNLGTSKSKSKQTGAPESMYQAEHDKQNQQILEMETELQKKNARLEEYHQEIQAKAKRNTELMKELIEFRKMTDGEASDKTGKTHSDLRTEYECLITTKKASLQKAVHSVIYRDDKRFTDILGEIFFNAHGECKTEVLCGLFQDLYRPHKDGEDMKAAKLQARVYGELLRASPTLTCDTQQLLKKVEIRLPELKELRKTANKRSISEFEAYLKEMVQLAWRMVTVGPPMLADQSGEFDEHLHERVYGQWDDHLIHSGSKYELVYYQPVLYNSYRDNIPASKGKVGNKEAK